MCFSLLKLYPITKIIIWENILKQYQGLPVCYADNQEKVENALNWMVDNTVKFREVFSKIVREYRG